MDGVSRNESAIERVIRPRQADFAVHNGGETVLVDLTEVRDRGFCGSQQKILQLHRAALSQPGLLFDEAVCDVMWNQAKSQFFQNRYACEELTACLDSRSGDCRWSFSDVIANPARQPQWVQTLAAYSRVIGDMQWRAHLQALDHHIKQMTRGKDSWYLKKAQELIQSKLTASLDNTIEVSKDVLNRELARLVREKNENASSILNNNRSSDNSASGVHVNAGA